jgi:hypothetical protein
VGRGPYREFVSLFNSFASYRVLIKYAVRHSICGAMVVAGTKALTLARMEEEEEGVKGKHDPQASLEGLAVR